MKKISNFKFPASQRLASTLARGEQISNYRYGFTLIELLVVIALISILSTAMMILINPIEQINRGKDTSSTSDAKMLLDAINRFYANQGYYPWQSSAADTTNLTRNPITVGSGWLCPACTGTPTVLSILSSNTYGTPEISTSFVNKVTGSSYNTLYVYNGSDSTNPNKSTYVCFKPNSTSVVNNNKIKWGTACGNMGNFSDIGAGSGPSSYVWGSLITICDQSLNLYATCLP